MDNDYIREFRHRAGNGYVFRIGQSREAPGREPSPLQERRSPLHRIRQHHMHQHPLPRQFSCSQGFADLYRYGLWAHYRHGVGIEHLFLECHEQQSIVDNDYRARGVRVPGMERFPIP